MKDHEQPGYSFTEGMTPLDMLHRLKAFAMYGLDECPEVDQLVAGLEQALAGAQAYGPGALPEYGSQDFIGHIIDIEV